MKHATKQPTKKIARNSSVLPNAPSTSEGAYILVPSEDIDPSPFNYRKVFPIQTLQELADSIAIHGIVENLTIRPMPSGRFELITGERRLRAAKIAGLTNVPAIIRDLTDDQVREIQLTENLQREDPHPLDEAEAIGRMLEQHQSIDNIAARLGKSKTFIYGRIKLLSLIAPFQELFAASILTLTESLSIATLSADSQQEFFDEQFDEWQEDDFEKPDVKDFVSGYRHDLTNAPFDIRDEALLPDVGACIQCPFNSSTVPTLFPELAEETNCTNGACFNRKCEAQFARSIQRSVQDQAPQALLFYGVPSTRLQEILAVLPQASALPQYDYRRFHTLELPVPPDREDYFGEEGAGSEDATDPEYERFAEALHDYENELDVYRDQLQKGEMLPGLLITERDCRFVAFNPNPVVSMEKCTFNGPANIMNATTKAIDAAIKSGTASPELIQAGITRSNEREQRLKQLDSEKVQLELHSRFLERMGWEGTMTPLTEADHAGINLVLYQSLDWNTRDMVKTILFHDRQGLDPDSAQDLFKALSSLTDEESAYLGRMALAARPESKYPSQIAGFFLYQVASQAGLNVRGIEQTQQAKAESRGKRFEMRQAVLQEQLAKLKAADRE